MIKALHLTKKINRATIIDDVSFKLPRTGIIGIHGPSGSGKSTLLKIIASLLEAQGSLQFFDLEIERLSIKDRLLFRKENIGLLYQSYRLFETETVAWNVALPLRLNGIQDKKLIDRHVRDSLKEVGLLDCLNQNSGALSGGQKQRVALARALVKQPRIILADEPTAALDEDNKLAIFDIFASLKNHRLIIIVSHDLSLLKQYCEILYELSDGHIESIINQKIAPLKKRMIHARLPVSKGTGHLPFLMRLRHAFMDMKRHRWRHISSQIILAIALLGTGLGVYISEAIESKMMTTISQFIGSSGMQVTSNAGPTSYLDDVYGAPEEDVNRIYQRYPDLVNGIGVTYRGNLDNLFPDRNSLFLIIDGPIVPLVSLQASHLANHLTFEEISMEPMSLHDDQIVLALPETELDTIGRSLRVGTDVEAINRFLQQNEIHLGAAFANDAWSYEDEQIWRLMGVVEHEKPLVLHDNPRFNEFVFETSMRLPSTTAMHGALPRPWYLRKAYHLMSDATVPLINLLSSDMSLTSYRFDHVSYDSMPRICPRLGRCPIDRISVFYDPHVTLPLPHIEYMSKAEPALGQPLITTAGGYFLYPDSMLSGFAHETFFAPTNTFMEQIIDWMSNVTIEGDIGSLPQSCARGYFQDQSRDSVRLKPLINDFLIGTSPQNTDQIAISYGLAMHLFSTSEVVDRPLFIGTRFTTGIVAERILSEFIVNEVRITAIIDEPGFCIYGCDMWSIAFFRDRVGIHGDSLRPLLVYFEAEQAQLDASLNRLRPLFTNYEFSFPQQSMRHQIEDITVKINYGVIALASVAGINAILLALFVLSLSWRDMARDRQLLFELGASQEAIEQLAGTRIIVLIGTSLLMGLIQLIVATLFIERFLADYFMSAYTYKFPILAVITMVILASVLFLLLWLGNHLMIKRIKLENI